MPTEVLVLGAGMVGTCTALQLARRGHAVTLIDRREPGRETSFGNAGIVQREAVSPHAFPRELAALWRVAGNQGTDVHLHWNALPGLLGPLARYWWHSAPARHARIGDDYARPIALCLQEHAALMAESGARELAQPLGYRHLFRTPAALQRAGATAQALAQRHGLKLALEDPAALQAAEPALKPGLAGALHWQDPWCVSDPGELVARYARRFVALGGRLLQGDAASLAPRGAGWCVHTAQGLVEAPHAVVALGPWSDALIRPLGYRLPLFIKRGYHVHFQGHAGLRGPVLDAERGYVLAPMAAGLRLTTGAEFARLGAPPTPVQVERASRAASDLLDLPPRQPEAPWLGNRPCTADMRPVMGPAPRHAGLWFNFGHAHQGFTLGPVAGRLLAELIEGVPPCVDPAPTLPARFA
jgi:D-amino-acid dehydrogenase